MKQNRQFFVKMLAVIILIIATPILFFVAIGENPFLDNSKGSKKIAIVNEDLGAQKEHNTIDFGKEISPILSSDSNYEWQVVSRSTANKGLEKKEYDAIIYIPSDFSGNILTYEEQSPQTVEFKYNVSDQINKIDREKVLREIDNASLKVNGKISVLYWSYVSQGLEKARQDFDNVLQKEKEFLNTISKFYKPNITTIADGLDNQKSMLENLQTSIASGSEALTNNVNNSKSFEDSITQFVTFINQYQEYQQSQYDLLQLMQNENVDLTTQFKNNHQPSFMAFQDFLNSRKEELNNKVKPLKQNIEDSERIINTLITHESKQQEEIWNVLEEVEGKLAVEYEKQLISLRKQLKTAKSKPNPIKTNDEETPTKVEFSSQMAALDGEREKLLILINDINALKVDMLSTNVAEDEQKNMDAILTSLTTKITDIEANINKIQLEDQKLKEHFVQSQTKGTTKSVVNNPIDEENQILSEEIKHKETSIVKLNHVNENKKARLQKVFNQPILNKNSDDLLAYYEALVKYESILNNSFSLNPGTISSNMNKILGITEEMQTNIADLKSSLPKTQKNLVTLQDEINNLFVDQLKYLEEQNAVITEQLNKMESSANNVKDKINAILTEAPKPSNNVPNGETLITEQSGISMELQAISESMVFITDNQEQMKSALNDLYGKAENINKDSNELSNKWDTNVKTTEFYRNDFKAVLNNAFVDGQKNGRIYEHLSTPLKSKSLDTTVKQEDKLPPVIILVIVLISGLMIGYFCYYFKQDKSLVRLALFILLNLVVGLIISTYGLDIYPLNEKSAIEWTIFTALLITCVSAVTFTGFSINNLVGWFVAIGVIVFFIMPIFTLVVPNINYEDPMSKVYLSIQYGSDSLMVPSTIIMTTIIAALALISYLIKRKDKGFVEADEESTLEG